MLRAAMVAMANLPELVQKRKARGFDVVVSWEAATMLNVAEQEHEIGGRKHLFSPWSEAHEHVTSQNEHQMPR